MREYLLATLCISSLASAVTVAKRQSAPSINPGPNGWISLGCYTDNVNSRTLQNGEALSGGAKGTTVAACTARCQQLGYQYAGLEYADECYCDDSVENGGIPVSSGCNMVCAGNSSEYCGGSNRLNLYQLSSAITKSTVLPTGWSSLGCFIDSTSARTLSHSYPVPGNSANMTAENCISVCQSNGYSLAGVEYSQECWCDNKLENGGSCAADQTTCNMHCTGNAAEVCGGSDRLNLYQYGAGTVSSCSATQPAMFSSINSIASSASNPTSPTTSIASTSPATSAKSVSSSAMRSTSITTSSTSSANPSPTPTTSHPASISAPPVTSTLTSSPTTTTTSSACPVTTSDNGGYFQNGDFEAGPSYSPWKVSVPQGSAQVTVNTDGFSLSGCSELAIMPANNTATTVIISQTVSGLTPGWYYIAKFYQGWPNDLDAPTNYSADPLMEGRMSTGGDIGGSYACGPYPQTCPYIGRVCCSVWQPIGWRLNPNTASFDFILNMTFPVRAYSAPLLLDDFTLKFSSYY